MEDVLLSATINIQTLQGYGVDSERLEIQLQMFGAEFGIPSNIFAVQDQLRAMSSDVRRMFNQIERVLKLLLVCPVSSCEAERSFSGHRHLQTWLRNSMGASMPQQCNSLQYPQTETGHN